MKAFLKSLLHGIGLDLKRYRPIKNEWLTDLHIDTILDIGANEGQFAKHINRILPQATIHSFEPVNKCYTNLRKNTEHLPVKTYPFALGEIEGLSVINVSAHSPSSSLLKMGDLHKRLYHHTVQHVQEEIQVKRLDSFYEAIGFPGCRCFVKIDVQGFEDRVIAGGQRILEEAVAIQIEMTYYELYEKQKLFDEIYDQLRSLGFRFKGNISQTSDPESGKITYSDSYFVNERYLTKAV